MPNTFWEFFGLCFKNSPRWKWWQLIWAGINILALFMGSLPENLRKGSLAIALFSGIEGAFKVSKNRETAFHTQIAELKRARDKDQEAVHLEAREKRDEREIPDVIVEMRDVRSAETKKLQILTGVVIRDENWYVQQLPNRDERLVRKAYKEWKKDDLH